MRKTIIFAVAMLTIVSFAQADFTSQYGVQIKDKSNDETALYKLFNSFFEEQLGGGGGVNPYNSSNELLNDRGINPYSDWKTSGSQMVGVFKSAEAEHTLTIADSRGDFSHSFGAISGTKGGAILDIEDAINLSDIPDGMLVHFNLAMDYEKSNYTWSSNQAGNAADILVGEAPNKYMGTQIDPVYGDGKAHMVALNITDLYNAKYATNNESVYMFGWEDMVADQGADWDYQDLIVIMTNMKNVPTDGNGSTPEPATLAVLGLGLAGLGMVSRRRYR